MGVLELIKVWGKHSLCVFVFVFVFAIVIVIVLVNRIGLVRKYVGEGGE